MKNPRVLLTWVVFIALGLTAACKSNRAKTEPPGPLVRTVEITGNESLTDDELIEHLNLQPVPVLSFGEKSYYLPGLEQIDSDRVEEVYATEGFFAAKVTDADVAIRREHKNVRRQRASVRFSVDEGRPTVVRELRFRWVGDTIANSQRPYFERACGLSPTTRFGIAPLNKAHEKILAALENAGYAYAKVDEKARVDTQLRLADVDVVIDPGEKKTIAELKIEGLERVPERLVRRELDFVVGRTFSRRRVDEVESAAYGLGVFSTVVVARGPQRTGSEMILVVRLQESKMQRVKFGVGAQIDPVRWQQRGTAQYEHRNLFGKLYGFRARLQAGYAQLPALYDPRQHGPIAKFDLQLTKKGLLEKRLVWTESPTVELGIWEGYQFYSVTNRLGVSRFFTRYFEMSLSYNNRFTDLFNVLPDLDRNRTILGLDFRDPYFLAFVEAKPTVYLTDSILDPKNGAQVSIAYDLANRYLGGQFSYHRIEPDVRGYYRPHERVQLAARARIGMQLPYGEAGAVPIDQKFYLGGSNDVRGWPLRRLSPRVSLCPDQPESCRGTPVGGLTMMHASAEIRVRIFRDLWMAGFADAGDVRAGVLEFVPQALLYTTGGGFRYYSKVGTFRLDVGGQLNDDVRFPEPRPWALHFGIGEAF